jgi:hypothetical protein
MATKIPHHYYRNKTSKVAATIAALEIEVDIDVDDLQDIFTWG